MISDILFFLIFILSIELAPLSSAFKIPTYWLLGTLFVLFYLLPLLTSKFLSKKPYWWGSACQFYFLLLFFIFYYFTATPSIFMLFHPFSQTTVVVFSCGLYLVALLFCIGQGRTRLLLTMALLYFLYVFLLELSLHFFSIDISLPLLLIGLPFFIFFFPLLLLWAWKAIPLPSSPLKSRLEALCKRVKFRYGGLYEMRAMDRWLSAAIVGLFPRFRYILFTPLLLEKFTEEEVEGVLSHEIGHSKHHHLLLFPLTFLGYIPLFFFISALITPYGVLLLLICEGLALVLYMRILVGPLARLMEKQADLYALKTLSAPPLIAALKKVSRLTGVKEEKVTWHHGSLRERILLLEIADKQPALIEKINKKIQKVWLVYFVLLAVISILVWIGGRNA